MPRPKKNAGPPPTELEQLTGKVVSCAMKIHRVLGCGFNLAIYKHSLAFEMKKMGFEFKRDAQLAANITADFVIADKIAVILTSLPVLDESMAPHESLLQEVNMRAGLLLNFGPNKLEFVNSLNKK